MVLDNEEIYINPFANFILNIGGIPVVCLVFSILFIVVVSIVFSILKCSSKKPFDFFFHKKLYYRPFKNKFARNWIQFYFFDMTYGEFYLVLNHICLCLIWFFWHNGYSLEYYGPFFYPIQHWTSRDICNGFGRVALLNYVLLLFPAQRFSVVQAVFNVGFDKGLKYHKIMGVVSFIAVWLHFLFLFVEFCHFYDDGAWVQFWLMITAWNKEETMNGTLPGLISGIALGILIITSKGVVRKYWYGFFFWIHMLSAAISFIMLIFHRKVMTIVLLSFGILSTLLDFGYRFFIGFVIPARIKHVEVYAAKRMIRLDIAKRAMTKHQSGQIIFLWLPRFFVSHPFTLCTTSSDPSNKNLFRVYIYKRGKFTSYLYDLAVNNPEKLKKLILRVDGVYGSKIDFSSYNNFMFVSENSGACVQFGLLKEIVYKKMKHIKPVFIWVVKSPVYLKVFKDDIIALKDEIDMRIYTPPVVRHVDSTTSINITKTSETESLIPKVEDNILSYLPPLIKEKFNFKTELGLIKSKKIGIHVFGSPNLVMTVKDVCYNSSRNCNIHLYEPSEFNM